MKTLKIIPLILLLTLTSCNIFNGVKGEGPVKTVEVIDLSEFTNVKISRGLQVELTQGNENKALIKANENLLDLITVVVEDNTLKISSKKNIYKADAKKVYLTYKNIENLHLNSGSHVKNTDVLKSEKLNIYAHSGAHAELYTKSDYIHCETHSGAHLNIKGFTNYSNILAHSGALLNAKNLQSKSVTAQAHSGAKIKVFATETINGQAHSGASIRFSGNPQNVSKQVHSGGNIYKI